MMDSLLNIAIAYDSIDVDRIMVYDPDKICGDALGPKSKDRFNDFILDRGDSIEIFVAYSGLSPGDLGRAIDNRYPLVNVSYYDERLALLNSPIEIARELNLDMKNDPRLFFE